MAHGEIDQTWGRDTYRPFVEQAPSTVRIVVENQHRALTEREMVEYGKLAAAAEAYLASTQETE